MFPDKQINFSQGSVNLTTAYAKLWMELFRRGSPELGELHDHMVERVVMDASDPPHIRIAVAAALMAVLQIMSSHRTKRHQYVDRKRQDALGERAELFMQIAAGERAEVDVTLPNGRQEEIIIEAGIRTVPSARATREQLPTAELRWTFVLGPSIPQSKVRPARKEYTDIAVHALAPLITPMEKRLTGAIGQDEYLAEWLPVFERTIGRVLLCRHDPAGLRRSYGGVIMTLLHMLELPTRPPQETGWDLEKAALEEGYQLGWGDSFPLLLDVCGKIADEGAVIATLYRGDVRLVSLAFAEGLREVLTVHGDFYEYEESDLVAALARLRPEDVTVDETLVPSPEAVKLSAGLPQIPPPVALTPAAGRPRKHPRPNEPCSCGSGRKYKKCCGVP